MEGKILFVELWGCRKEQIDSVDFLMDAVKEIAKACRLTILNTMHHRFRPQGVSVISMIAESHIATYSWPEKDYLSVFIYTCGKEDPEAALPLIKEKFVHSRIMKRTWD